MGLPAYFFVVAIFTSLFVSFVYRLIYIKSILYVTCLSKFSWINWVLKITSKILPRIVIQGCENISLYNNYCYVWP